MEIRLWVPWGNQVVDHWNNVEEDKEDIQYQTRVGIILIAQFLYERDWFDRKEKTQWKDKRDDCDKGHPKSVRQKILLIGQHEKRGQPCGHERQ